MKSMKALCAVAGAAVTLGFTGSAAADEGLTPYYLGASVGQSKFKDGCFGASNCDDSDAAWRVFGGYQFNRYFAAEVDYHDFGEASRSIGSLKGNAWSIIGVGSYPFADRFSLYGKLGAYSGQLKLPDGDKTTSDVTYGLGVRYDFTPHIGVRGEWQRYSNMETVSGLQTHVDVFSLGVLYRF